MEDFNKAYREYERSIHYVVRQFLGKLELYNIEYEDAFSICSLGFYKAFKKFDKNRKVKFNTYATSFMIKFLQAELRKYQATKRIPHQLVDSVFDMEDTDEVSIYNIIPSEDNTEKDVMLKQAHKKLMERLGVDDKLFKVYYYTMEGYKQREIMEFMNCSQSKVSTMYKEVKNIIDEVLGEYYDK